MKNKQINLNLNILNYKIKLIGINNINPKIEKFNQNIKSKDKYFHSYNNKILPEYKNTFTNINIENNKVDLNKQKKNNLIISKKSISEDKLIQTPPSFYSCDNILKISTKCITPNIREKKNKRIIHHYIISKGNNQLKNNIKIHEIKSAYFSKSFNKLRKIKDLKHSRNRLYPLIKNNKNKTSEMQKFFKKYNILREYFNNVNKEEKRNHHNLLTIENIYFQGRNTNNNFKISSSNYESNKKLNLNLTLLKKKYSVKEIKYPLYNNSRNKYNIINDNNAHLLEEIYRKQTLSNFNNKYTLKYKTNNSIKKENITKLFSLLKKYKYSDIDKKNAFSKFNSMKKISKLVNI